MTTQKRRVGAPSIKDRDGDPANFPPRLKAFLKVLPEVGTIANAARAMNLTYHTVFNLHDRWLKKSATYRAAYEAAIEESTQLLEGEVMRRAFQGVVKKKFNAKGEPIIDPETKKQYLEREYSDQLAIFILKARRPVYARNCGIGLRVGQLEDDADDAEPDESDRIAGRGRDELRRQTLARLQREEERRGLGGPVINGGMITGPEMDSE
jgi:hypothetical protein